MATICMETNHILWIELLRMYMFAIVAAPCSLATYKQSIAMFSVKVICDNFLDRVHTAIPEQ